MTTYDELAHTTAYKPLWPPTQATDTAAAPTRARATIEAGKLRDYLLAKKSPLADHAERILESEYWSTIIGICTIEQYGCSRLPYGNNFNLWGIGGASGLRHYSTAPEGIDAIHNLLTRYESRGYDTIEKLNGYYVQPASANWYRVVTQTKAHLESL